ncbi:hypothetical protein J421_2067 [Gemmatirosa kalamazoonensis]|uniref:Uncharacterized protein n=1 Tax=Gemmatirosa kalamazoonensis TaxID=861299 RepID=W0RES2_9BACT|nr:hypothetical protein [Gemmatirosa kalamazoonensis]AHG89604.1 hypothetical protein J421_2067 [Gemmatirosa kalamazoonensis]
MSPSFFPRETHVFHSFELSGWRTMSLRVVEMAALTGVLLRALRALTLARSPSTAATAIAFVLGASVLLGMLTLHLANFPVRRWPWRVLAFAMVETTAEMIVSAVLVALHREPLGTTGRAAWSDLPSMALTTLEWRVVSLALFALVLAVIVQLVRRLLPRHVPHHSPPTIP